MILQWTTNPPTEPGWYWVKYNGYRTGVRIKTIFHLDRPERGGFFDTKVPLVRIEIGRDAERQEWEIRFHPSCEPVYWAGPIEEPSE